MMRRRIRIWAMSVCSLGLGLSVVNGQTPTEEPALGSVERLALDVKQRQSDFSKRLEAIRYLATLDCRYQPDAERTLILALRSDPSEEVRLEVAQALERGCCDTRGIIEVLKVAAAGTSIDGYPGERSDRIRTTAANAVMQAQQRMHQRPAVAIKPGTNPGTKPISPPRRVMVPTQPKFTSAAPLLQPINQTIPPARLQSPTTPMEPPMPTPVPVPTATIAPPRPLILAAATEPITPPAPLALPELTPVPVDGPTLPPIVTKIVESIEKPAEETIPSTIDTLNQSLDRYARLDAIRQLETENFAENPAIVKALIGRVHADKDATVRFNCLRALLKFGPDLPEVRAALPKWAGHPDRLIRFEADYARKRIAAAESNE